MKACSVPLYYVLQSNNELVQLDWNPEKRNIFCCKTCHLCDLYTPKLLECTADQG